MAMMMKPEMIPKSTTLATTFETVWICSSGSLEKKRMNHGDRDQPGHGREERGQQNGQEDVRRIGGAELRAVDHDADGNEREPGRIEDQEHDLRVRGRVLVGIQLLELLHGLEPQRGRCVVEPEHVGGEVHDDRPVRRVVRGDLGKQPMEERPHELRQHVHRPAPFPDPHQPQPQREHTGEAEGDLEPELGHVERAVHHGREDLGVVEEDQAHQPHDQRDQEERDPDEVQDHGRSLRSRCVVRSVECGVHGADFMASTRDTGGVVARE
jgi:hypothetical protein